MFAASFRRGSTRLVLCVVKSIGARDTPASVVHARGQPVISCAASPETVISRRGYELRKIVQISLRASVSRNCPHPFFTRLFTHFTPDSLLKTQPPRHSLVVHCTSSFPRLRTHSGLTAACTQRRFVRPNKGWSELSGGDTVTPSAGLSATPIPIPLQKFPVAAEHVAVPVRAVQVRNSLDVFVRVPPLEVENVEICAASI